MTRLVLVEAVSSDPGESATVHDVVVGDVVVEPQLVVPLRASLPRVVVAVVTSRLRSILAADAIACSLSCRLAARVAYLTLVLRRDVEDSAAEANNKASDSPLLRHLDCNNRHRRVRQPEVAHPVNLGSVAVAVAGPADRHNRMPESLRTDRNSLSPILFPSNLKYQR